MAKDIESLFVMRRAKWRTQNLKYLRYVLNDHFVLVLMFLIGFLAYQYAAFLQKMPEHWLPGYLISIFVSLLILFIGQLATFVETADQQFLLAKEQAVQRHLKAAVKNSMVLPILIIFVTVTILSPLVALPLPVVLVWMAGLIGIKYGLLLRQSQSFIAHQLIQWQPLINYERNRQNKILKIFSQFTDVKGLKQTARRRKYLDRLIPKSKQAYDYLFIRTFLRSGDYFMLMLRLTGLGILSLVAIDNDLFSLLLALLFNYLLVFQLLPISQSQDYQMLARLYPIKADAKLAAAASVIRRLILLISGLQLVISLVTFHDIRLAGMFILSGLFLGVIYPKLKLKTR